MTKLTRINLWGLAKFQTILFALLGILAGILYSFGGLIIDALVSLNWITTDETLGLSYGTILAFGALIGMPLVSAGVGLVLGVIEAILYNMYARLFNGFYIKLGNE